MFCRYSKKEKNKVKENLQQIWIKLIKIYLLVKSIFSYFCFWMDERNKKTVLLLSYLFQKISLLSIWQFWKVGLLKLWILLLIYFILMESNDGEQRKRYNRKKNNVLETKITSERGSNFLKIFDGYFFYVFSKVTLLVWLLFLRLPFLDIFFNLLRLKELE